MSDDADTQVPIAIGVRFIEWVRMCAGSREFVANYDRLTGETLSHIASRDPLARMIDEATGRQDDQLRKFVDFCWDLFQRMPPNDTGQRASTGSKG